jgi:hypothetical protein
VFVGTVRWSETIQCVRKRPFCCAYLEMGVSRTICPGWPRTMILLISASQVAGIAGVSHRLLAETNSCTTRWSICHSLPYLLFHRSHVCLWHVLSALVTDHVGLVTWFCHCEACQKSDLHTEAQTPSHLQRPHLGAAVSLTHSLTFLWVCNTLTFSLR